MTELYIRIVELDGKPSFVEMGGMTFNQFELLALASRAADESTDAAKDILKFASMLFHWQDDWAFKELYGLIAMNVARISMNSEIDLYGQFESCLTKLFGDNAKVIRRKNNPRHIPDSWVRIDDEDIPVEVKLHKFNSKALNQLQRYMDIYGCSKGIAVGEKATVDLPDNIIFVSIDEIKEKLRETNPKKGA